MMQTLPNPFKTFQLLFILSVLMISNTVLAQESENLASKSTEIKSSDKHNASEVFDDKEFKRLEKRYLSELEKDKENKELNKKLGMLYYNKAESMVKEIDYEGVSLMELNSIQDSIIVYFRKSLPYMKKGEGYSVE